MRICEEYIKRHKLQTKVYPHIDNGAILLRFKEDGRITWLVTKIRWVHEPQYHPGKYHIQTMKPQYDALRRTSFFRDVQRETIYWDQYHDHLDHWLKNVDKDSIVHGKKEVSLAVWEMFMFCNDTQLSRMSNIDEKIYPTIDPSRSVEERYEAFQGLQTNILHPDPDRSDVARFWYSEFNGRIIQNYLHWLAESAVK